MNLIRLSPGSFFPGWLAFLAPRVPIAKKTFTLFARTRKGFLVMKTVAVNLAATPSNAEPEALALLGASTIAPRETISILSLVNSLTSEAEEALTVVRCTDGLVSLKAEPGVVSGGVYDLLQTSLLSTASLVFQAAAAVGSGRSRALMFPGATITPAAVTNMGLVDGNSALFDLIALPSAPKYTAGQLLEAVDNFFTDPETGVTQNYTAILDQTSGLFSVYQDGCSLADFAALSVGLLANGWRLDKAFDLIDILPETPPVDTSPIWG